MQKTSKTIVFFGSGPVAATSLELLTKHLNIEAVVTKPKPAYHRGDFPVIALAERLSLQTLYASNKQELTDLFATKPVTSRLGIVIDFGVIIPREVIDYCPLGIINSHFSLLPKWRGADPISFAILEGDAKTGVSLMLIDENLDTGKLIVQKSLIIEPDETTPTLTDKLISLSDELLATYVPRYISGDITPRVQPHPSRATYSRKLTKDDGVIDWHKPAVRIEREIRAFIEWPKSHTQIAGKEVIITQARVIDATGKPGQFTISDRQVTVYTGKQALVIARLKLAGKNEMSGDSFIAGYGQLLH